MSLDRATYSSTWATKLWLLLRSRKIQELSNDYIKLRLSWPLWVYTVHAVHLYSFEILNKKDTRQNSLQFSCNRDFLAIYFTLEIRNVYR